MFAEGTRQASAFQIYVKNNIKTIGEEMPGQSRGAIMREVGRRWTIAKEMNA